MADRTAESRERGPAIRDVIRAELETTRAAFHALLETVPDEDWHRPSGNRAWTVGQVLYHMTLALRFLPQDVWLIRHLGWTPPLPGGLFDWLMDHMTRWSARGLSRRQVAQRYDAAHALVLRVLETIQDDEWARGMDYPDWDPLLSGYVTPTRCARGWPALASTLGPGSGRAAGRSR
jgi:hypothetical protein